MLDATMARPSSISLGQTAPPRSASSGGSVAPGARAVSSGPWGLGVPVSCPSPSRRGSPSSRLRGAATWASPTQVSTAPPLHGLQGG